MNDELITNAENSYKLQRFICYNLGCYLMEERKYSAAIEAFDRSILIGGKMEPLWNKCIALLYNKQWLEGIKLYYLRYERDPNISNDVVSFPNLPIPMANCRDDLINKKVLVLNEQGFGDEFMFSMAIPKMSKFCKFMKCQCYKENFILFKNSFKNIRNIEFFIERSFDINFVNQFDIYTCTGDLFTYFQNYENNLPTPCNSYLNPENKIKINKKRKNIGICWKSSSGSRNMEDREINIDNLKFLKEEYELYPLVKNIEIPEWLNKIEFENFDITASYIKEMDIIITIDSAIAHLSGMMNKKTILLYKNYLDWRWEYKNIDNYSLIYPATKIVKLKDFLSNPNSFI